MAALVFLEKLTVNPDEVTSEDAEAVYATGVSKQALRDAAEVCALFNMIVRLADSHGWDVPPWERLADESTCVKRWKMRSMSS